MRSFKHVDLTYRFCHTRLGHKDYIKVNKNSAGPSSSEAQTDSKEHAVLDSQLLHGIACRRRVDIGLGREGGGRQEGVHLQLLVKYWGY